jgi:hypothetical protein
MMGLNLQVYLSDVDEVYKTAFKNLTNIILKKKRLHTTQTELDRIEKGDLPLPNNGRLNDFLQYMELVNNILGVTLSPMTMWYALCLGLDNQQLKVKQLIHCVDSIKQDRPGLDPHQLLTSLHLQPVIIHTITDLEYNCIFTGNDTKSTGGLKIKTHQSSSGYTCTPKWVVSVEGYDAFMRQPNKLCPQCYSRITANDFEHIEAHSASDIDLFNDVPHASTVELTSAAAAIPTQATSALDSATSAMTSSMSGMSLASAVAAQPAQKKILIIMKGTVGCGKTSYAAEITKRVQELGGTCINEGTDKYCTQGIPIPSAIAQVTAKLNTIPSIKTKLIVVIIDTCGERNNSDKIFGYNFTGWQRIVITPNFNQHNPKGYMAWTLRNVLTRAPSTATTPYWLNHHGPGVAVCVNVHAKKAKDNFGGSFQRPSSKTRVDEILLDIKEDADKYQEYLNESHGFDAMINRAMIGINN